MNSHDFSGDEVYAEDLTWREQDVLRLLAERQSNREIAENLHLAENTVKDYVSKILSKLYVKNRREAVERAKVLGLLDRSDASASKSITSLPAEPTPFVGRQGELREIQRLLAGTRLLTLTGPGGVGKTRLALRSALETSGDFSDGCFFIALAPLRSANPLVQTIAESVKFPLATQEDPLYQLLRYLKSRQLLLVMDNFEHLLDGAAVVSEIIQNAPAVKVLATSRERLNLRSETILNIDGMAVPDQAALADTQDYDAIALFVQSARKVHPGFEPAADELHKIANICQIVQGMPLAIELAAAWLRILNVAEIYEELKQGLDILSTEARDAPERHRSIRSVFDHSWSLLDQTEQEIFMRLTVFRGGFTRPAAEQVAGASLPLLAELVSKSFLKHEQGTGRLEIHELLRQYAQEHLERSPNDNVLTLEAHADYYAEFMQHRGQDLRGQRQMQALIEIEADLENVRTAWRYYLEQVNAPQIWKFIFGLWHVCWIRWWNHAGMELFAEAVRVLQGEQAKEAETTRALAMAFQSYFMSWLGLAEEGYELAKESVQILEQHDQLEALFFAYNSFCLNAYFLNLIAEEIDAVNKMLEIAAVIDDQWLSAFTLFGASMAALLQDDYAEAQQLADLYLSLSEEVGDVISSTIPLIILGHVALAHDEYEDARGYYLRCLNISEQVGFHYSIQTASKYLGKVAVSNGNLKEAEYYLMKSLKISKEIGFVRDIINLLYEFARLRTAEGELEQAVEMLGLVLQHPARHQTRWLEGSISHSAKSLLAELESRLSPGTFAAALERGQALDLDVLVADLLS